MNKPDILNKILATKAEEIARSSQVQSLSQLKQAVATMPACRGFTKTMVERMLSQQNAIIAEAKKASPSKGLLRENFSVSEIAASYQKGGASCLSVLTDEHYFQGHLDYLQEAKQACDLPILRKDFIIDEYQVYQSLAAGADCILLIVAALEETKLVELNDCAQKIGLDVLVEVHDLEELKAALKLDNVLLGINNRNLRSFETSLQTTIDLLSHIPDDKPVVTESGIHRRQDIKLMNEHQVFGFLIGEAFMRVESPGDKLQELFA